VVDHDPRMAPPNLAWHRKYVRILIKVWALLDDLQNDPRIEGAEDLGYWVEMLNTLISFRPTTRDDIELDVRRELGIVDGTPESRDAAWKKLTTEV